jgi:hypothetical protein
LNEQEKRTGQEIFAEELSWRPPVILFDVYWITDPIPPSGATNDRFFRSASEYNQKGWALNHGGGISTGLTDVNVFIDQ